jgi:RND family efflux transporter MFP subunit
MGRPAPPLLMSGIPETAPVALNPLGDHPMLRRRLIGVLLVLGLAGPPGRAADPPHPASDVIVLKRCEVEYARSSQVGVASMLASATILQDCHVQEGDRVKAGQVLGRVMDQELRAELELRKAEAESDIEIRLSEAKHEQMLDRLKRSENLQRRATYLVSGEEFNLHKVEEKTAALEVEQAKHRHRLAQVQRQQTEVLIHAREFISPHDGIVVEVLKRAGEAVSYSEPIFRVVEVDRVRVTGHLNLSDYWRVRKGQRVRIIPEIEGADLAIEREEFAGEVIFLDSRIDPVTRTCKIITEVENRDLLLASGLEARMEISIEDAPSSRRPEDVAKPVPPPPQTRAEVVPAAQPAETVRLSEQGVEHGPSVQQ